MHVIVNGKAGVAVRRDVPFADLSGMTQDVRGCVVDAWTRLLDTGHFVGGDVVSEFETRWAEYCGTSEAIGVANGTDALYLTLLALGIGAGEEVIIPTNTFVATAEAVVLAGATPRFVDVDPDTLLMTPETLEDAIGPRTSAVIVVHLYGQMADIETLSRVANRHGLVLIEDAAQAHGATWNGLRAGSVGRAGCFSFYPAKNLGAFGDAGAITTSDAELARRIRCLRDHGRLDGGHYQHVEVGTNSRLDALQAAVLTAKLDLLDTWTEARRSIAARYRAATAGTAFRLVSEAPQATGVYHLAVARVPERDRVRAAFASMGVTTSIHYPTPCHLLIPYRRFAKDPLPVAETAASEILSLPMFPHLDALQLAQVCESIQVVDELLVNEEAVRV